MDGIETPEDMNTCIFDAYTLKKFWKNWHMSLNLWIIRYLYTPLGGYKRKYFNTILVFLFVGCIHSLTDNMAVWSIATGFGFVLESLIIEKVWKALPVAKYWFLKYICSYMAGFLYVIQLCINMMGYCYGYHKFMDLFGGFFNLNGFFSKYFICIIYLFWI